MDWLIYIALGLFGATFGSFAIATMWRIRARQLEDDKRHKEPVDSVEYKKLKPLLGHSFSRDRSRCLSCGYALKWYDMVPILSWVLLGGKCRRCRKPIGYTEVIAEIGLAAFFVASYMLWPFVLDSGWEIARFVVWLIAGVVLTILWAYDARWYLLPDKLTLLLALLGVVTVAIAAIQSEDIVGTLVHALGAVAVLGGLYALLYAVSRGAWVGFGDVKLGVGLGLLLADWRLALIALFLANIIGCLVVLPLLATKKLRGRSRVPFGPFLIAGTIIAYFFGFSLLTWYTGLLIG